MKRSTPRKLTVRSTSAASTGTVKSPPLGAPGWPRKVSAIARPPSVRSFNGDLDTVLVILNGTHDMAAPNLAPRGACQGIGELIGSANDVVHRGLAEVALQDQRGGHQSGKPVGFRYEEVP